MATLADDRPLSTPVEVLETFAGLLSQPQEHQESTEKTGADEDENKWSRILWESTSRTSAQSLSSSCGDDDDGTDCDFSSFPSLSILKQGATEKSDAVFHYKESVEAHCASLLSRPILVSNDQTQHCEEEEEEEEGAFFADNISQVPQLMQQNLTEAFSTLIQSRLRAYATFLARHGMAMAESSETAHELEEGVAGVEQKLETMLEIGSLVCLNTVSTSFQAQQESSASQKDEDDLQVSLPLRLEASAVVLIPAIQSEAEKMDVAFATNGSISGIFYQGPKTHLLRVAQVDLDTGELLSRMKEQAAAVVSKIVDATNAAYALPLPRLLGQAENAMPMNTKKRPHVIEDDLPMISPEVEARTGADHPSELDLSEHDDFAALSPDKCGQIVDCLFDDGTYRRVLNFPGKRARFSSSCDEISDIVDSFEN